MNFSRRDFLLQADPIAASHKQATDQNHIVVIYLRGGADGLNITVPHASDEYYRLRPSVRIERPGTLGGGALDLDGYFGLHPALEPLLASWQANDLAIIHAAGSPHPSRSHFDAQTIMETGVQDARATLDGWLGRYLSLSQSTASSPFRAVALARTTPRSLRGPIPALALTGFADFDATLGEGEAFLEALSDLYRSETPQAQQSRLATEVLGVLRATNPADISPENGAQYPATGFAQSLRKAVQLIRAELSTEIISIDIGGWDTHANQNPALAARLSELAGGLQAYMTDLGSQLAARVTTVVMTEFGRRASENGSAGTDHGHGGVMLVLGGNVNGGRVYAEWPGLQTDDLDRGDLRVTTDYRQVLSELLLAKASPTKLDEVFPGFKMGSAIGLFGN